MQISCNCFVSWDQSLYSLFIYFFDVTTSENISRLDIFPKAQTQAKSETYVNKADKRHYKAQGISV